MFIDDPEVTAAEAVIDNGAFGKRVVRFETGRLAKQAAGRGPRRLVRESTGPAAQRGRGHW